jgi:hypothetical protein
MSTHTHDSYTTSPVRMRVLTLADFGETLLAIKQGLRMRRSGWPDEDGVHRARRCRMMRAPYIYLKTASDGLATRWLPSQSDLLALDWRTL